MADSKVFDVAHPKTDDVTAPTVKPPRKIMLSEPVLEQGTSATPEIEDTPEVVDKNPISRTGTKITPRTENITVDSETAPEVGSWEVAASEKSPTTELPAENPTSTVQKEVAETETEEPAVEKVEPVKDLSSIDSILPDTSQRASAVAKDAMQSPVMFDTKAYYVPIGNSQHKHGHVLGAIVAGIITAAIVVGSILLLAKLT
jgi:hypothetical protein